MPAHLQSAPLRITGANSIGVNEIVQRIIDDLDVRIGAAWRSDPGVRLAATDRGRASQFHATPGRGEKNTAPDTRYRYSRQVFRAGRMMSVAEEKILDICLEEANAPACRLASAEGWWRSKKG